MGCLRCALVFATLAGRSEHARTASSGSAKTWGSFLRASPIFGKRHPAMNRPVGVVPSTNDHPRCIDGEGTRAIGGARSKKLAGNRKDGDFAVRIAEERAALKVVVFDVSDGRALLDEAIHPGA
jgi:hypothetical protein